jgi:hypothetical protein
MKLMQSYVFHKDQCFFVSTANRACSALGASDIIYAETLVWESNTRKFSQDRLIHQGEDRRDGLDTHFKICKQLFQTGACVDKEDDDE